MELESEKSKATLAELLDSNGYDGILSDSEQQQQQEDQNDKQQEDTNEIDPNFCIDCRDMPCEINCQTCNEPFCKVCFKLVHKSGSRKNHIFEQVKSHLTENENNIDENGNKIVDDNNNDDDDDDQYNQITKDDNEQDITKKLLFHIKRQANFIPLRLTSEERRLLRLLEAALNVSEYTDRVDILSYKSKTKRIVEQLKEICSILAGLVVASNLKIGQNLIQDKNFVDNENWYKTIFEIGRRYKIMNPERMRDTFGKLCYMVMDSRLPEIKEHMEFDLYKPIKTVYSYLQSKKQQDNGLGLKILQDPLILDATAEIKPKGKTRTLINRQIKLKESAIEKLSSKYSSVNGFNKEELRQVLYSIGDFNSYTNSNRNPIERMIKRLEDFFINSHESNTYSLGIRFGYGGARLSHNHEKQYQYVRQSLELWSHIMREMISLWSAADEDLFSPYKYSLTSTGQGLNRVKACPTVFKKMHSILQECQSKCNGWVGSSAIHLGDHTVPNALFFLDKYTQVPRILIPVDQTLNQIDELSKDPFAKQYMESQFGSVKDLKLNILCDFFRHAFDGSGSDNFFDAGSCIDGRLTSAWNWANKISDKDYYKFFLMSGFVGFNGSEGF